MSTVVWYLFEVKAIELVCGPKIGEMPMWQNESEDVFVKSRISLGIYLWFSKWVIGFYAYLPSNELFRVTKIKNQNEAPRQKYSSEPEWILIADVYISLSIVWRVSSSERKRQLFCFQLNECGFSVISCVCSLIASSSRRWWHFDLTIGLLCKSVSSVVVFYLS